MIAISKARTIIWDRINSYPCKDEVDFCVSAAESSDDGSTFNILCAYVAEVLMSSRLDQDSNNEAEVGLNPLAIERFTSEKGNEILDADITVGGPTVRLRYESLWREVTVTASWGADVVEVRSQHCPVVSLMEWL